MGLRLSTLLHVSERRRPTFDEALAAAREGAPWALGWLYRRFQPSLLRMLAVIAPHHADDLASDVWLEVAGTLGKFDGDEAAFRTWLATTARRRVITASRAEGRRSGRSLEDDEQVAAASFAAQVVSVLSPDQAHVVLLRVVEGLDVEAVARALGKQPGAVRSLQQRALRRLALQLEPGALPA
jgi:RNA polymerase sigma-70 factor, ECF subfamily